MLELEVIEDAATAAVALDPIRGRLLAELVEPRSAAALADRVGMPRQKVNYHLRALEAHGLARVVEERRWGGLTERVLAASAASYVVSPAALGKVGSDPARTADRLSAEYLIALAARVVREVGSLVRTADRLQKRLPTLALDAEIRFRSPAERAAFSEELTSAVTALVARYHDACAPGGRSHRLMVAAHPLPHTKETKETRETKETP
jgi:DNA-binding transcriptional ArsR family regulator